MTPSQITLLMATNALSPEAQRAFEDPRTKDVWNRRTPLDQWPPHLQPLRQWLEQRMAEATEHPLQ